MRWLGRSILWLALLVSLAFNAGVGATYGVRSYRSYCESRGHGPCASPFDIEQKLNLSPEQAERLRASRQALFDGLREMRGQMRADDEALADLLSAEQPDRDAIAAALDRIEDHRRAMQQRVIDHVLAVSADLDPAQRESFKELLRGGMFRRPGEGWGGRHRPMHHEGSPKEEPTGGGG